MRVSNPVHGDHLLSPDAVRPRAGQGVNDVVPLHHSLHLDLRLAQTGVVRVVEEASDGAREDDIRLFLSCFQRLVNAVYAGLQHGVVERIVDGRHSDGERQQDGEGATEYCRPHGDADRVLCQSGGEEARLLLENTSQSSESSPSNAGQRSTDHGGGVVACQRRGQ